MNILVIKQSALGDVLHSTAPVHSLRQHYPQAHITLLTSRQAAPIYQHNPDVDRIVIFEKDRLKQEWRRNFRGAISHFLEVLEEINDREYALAFDLQGLLRTAIFLYLAKARVKCAKGNWRFVQHFSNRELHAIEEMNRVLALAGIAANSHQMHIHTSEIEQSQILSLLGEINPENKRILILAPFTRWPTKEWDLTHYRELLRRLPSTIFPIFTGTHADQQRIETAIGDTAAINLAGRLSVLEFAELMRHADAALCSDSFPMHLASALNTPLIALFGPTDETKVGPLSPDARVLRADVDCDRCYRRNQCEKNCINAISVESVQRELMQIIGT